MKNVLALIILVTVSWALPASAVPIFDNVVSSENDVDTSIQQNLQVGDEIYGDRAYTFTAIDAALLGQEWIQTANDSKNDGGTLSFQTLVTAIMYLWIDDRVDIAADMSWVANDGWVLSGLSATETSEFNIAQTYSIYSMLGGAGNYTTGAQTGGSYYGLSAAVVPEPGTLVLFGLGLAGIGFIRRKV